MKVGIVVFSIALSFAPCVQSASGPHQTDAHEHDAAEGPSAFEADFAASDIFRTGSYIQPLWKRLSFEGHYFAEEGSDVGFSGGSYTVRFGELKLSPGFGVAFGSDGFATAPAATFRWDFEHSWFVTQGLFLQGFRETRAGSEETEHGHAEHAVEPATFYPSISDGSHVSARWKRLTVGGTWEHIHFREGNEWKGGGRLAVRLLPRVSGVLFVFGPGRAEWRGGIVIHPPQSH